MAIDPQHIQDYDQPATSKTVDPLSFIRPRAREAMSAYHSRLVIFLRYVLPVAAFLVLAALFIWPVISPNKIAALAVKNIPDLVIKNLHFTGIDTKNEPYSLEAAKATRPSGLQNIYDFDQPKGEITLGNGSWVSGKAAYGRFDQDTHKLWLGGDVQLYQDKGYQFVTDEAQIDLKQSNAWGDSPVLVQGDFGVIRGKGFRMLDSGKVMVINGPAHALLDLHKKSSSDKPASAPHQP